MPGSPGGTAESTPTVMARAPGAPGDTATGGRRGRRDLVIFGVVAGLVLVAAVVAILLVILLSD
jgi:hypothetical protein